MKKNKASGIILAVLTALSMTACNEVPEDVKSRAEQQKAPTASIETDEQGRVRINNLTFECCPEPYDPNNIYEFKRADGELYDEAKDYSELKSKVIRAGREILGIDISEGEIEIATEKDLPVYDEEGKEIPGKKREVRDPDANFYSEGKGSVVLHETGDSIFMYAYSGYTGKYPDRYFYRDIYYPWSYPEDKVVMNDRSEMTIREAVDKGEEIINKIKDIGIVNSMTELTLSKISVQHSDGDGAVIELYYSKKLGGVRFLEDGCESNIRGDERISGFQFKIGLMGKDKVLSVISNSQQTEKPTEKVRVMTYEDARQRVAEALAPNLVYTVREAHLCYAEVWKGDFVVTRSGYRPMWEFVLYDPSRRKKIFSMNDLLNGTMDNTAFSDFPKAAALVDAQNGDVYYLNPFEQVISIRKSEE